MKSYIITDENGYIEQPISIKGFDEIYEEGYTYNNSFNYYAFELVGVLDKKAN